MQKITYQKALVEYERVRHNHICNSGFLDEEAVVSEDVNHAQFQNVLNMSDEEAARLWDGIGKLLRISNESYNELNAKVEVSGEFL